MSCCGARLSTFCVESLCCVHTCGQGFGAGATRSRGIWLEQEPSLCQAQPTEPRVIGLLQASLYIDICIEVSRTLGKLTRHGLRENCKGIIMRDRLGCLFRIVELDQQSKNSLTPSSESGSVKRARREVRSLPQSLPRRVHLGQAIKQLLKTGLAQLELRLGSFSQAEFCRV